MFYIHQAYCISPQQTFKDINIEILHEPVDQKLLATEPAYEGIPPGILRRMGKAIRMGVGAAMPIIKSGEPLNGIIIGTAKGGMEDCIKFLNQIVQYDEGLLAPGNFVQSTSNAIAAQLGLLSNNKSCNTTHVHRGLAFENAVIDTLMQLNEFAGKNYLLGGIDEISGFNYNIENLAGAYKKEAVSNKQLYETNSPGTIAGEGAAMFLVSHQKDNAIAQLKAIQTLHSEDDGLVKNTLQQFIKNHLPAGEKIDLLISGENGDNRTIKYYTDCEELMSKDTAIARFKHLSGDVPTASAFALWLACYVLQQKILPAHMIKKPFTGSSCKNILLYNNYKGLQHGFMLIKQC
jgi:Beta-ketoacyl synthase, N-terminal domain